MLTKVLIISSLILAYKGLNLIFKKIKREYKGRRDMRYKTGYKGNITPYTIYFTPEELSKNRNIGYIILLLSAIVFVSYLIILKQ